MVPYVERLRRRDAQARQGILNFWKEKDYPSIACISFPWKLVCHLGRQEDELYDLEKDGRERVNLMRDEKAKLDDIHEELRRRYLQPETTPTGGIRRDSMSLSMKEVLARTVIDGALAEFKKPVLVWAGGKDSTLVLYLAREVLGKEGLRDLALLFVDHDQHFPETWAFLEEITEKEDLQVSIARNENLFAAAEDGSSSVPWEALDAENQEEALKAGLQGSRVPLSLEEPVGNHLLKTIALKRAIVEHGFDAVISGIRWDEGPARSKEVFFSPREDPGHMRVHPILPWTERDVWVHTLANDLPVHPLYERGYRSFDGMKDSRPTGTRPAWEQDLEKSSERAGRSQDKEGIMEQLRSLGYF